jgi:glutamate synthase (NADPH) large chain
MVELEPVSRVAGPTDDPERPRQKSISSENSGMGDMLRFDAERLRILVERHLLHTGSARARELLDNWGEALKHFVKVMPTDYRRALLELKAEKQAVVAAE